MRSTPIGHPVTLMHHTSRHTSRVPRAASDRSLTKLDEPPPVSSQSVHQDGAQALVTALRRS